MKTTKHHHSKESHDSITNNHDARAPSLSIGQKHEIKKDSELHQFASQTKVKDLSLGSASAIRLLMPSEIKDED